MFKTFSIVTTVFSVLLASHLNTVFTQTLQDVTQGPITEGDNGGTPSDFFLHYIIPMIKYSMMTTGNKTENEAQNIIDVISTRVKNESDSLGGSDVNVENPSSSQISTAGNFFTDYITPIIKHGMMTSGNKTEMEADALVDVISTAVEMKSQTQTPTSDPISVSSPSSPLTTAIPPSVSSSADFFKDYISPIMSVGMAAPGSIDETEASSILNTAASAMVKEPSNDGAPDLSPFKSPNFFNDHILPMIKLGIMSKGNKSEIEADTIVNIISSAIKSRKLSDNVSQSDTSLQGSVPKPSVFFDNFVSPLIRYSMINKHNKTADEADAIMNIISYGMATKKDMNSTNSVMPLDKASFFSNFIAPIIRIGMVTSGNKTEAEADSIIAAIKATVANKGSQSSSPILGKPKSDGGSGNFFIDYISPLIKYHMTNSGNKTENEADAILNIISTSIQKQSKEDPEQKDEIVDQDIPVVSEDGVNGKQNVSYFQEFILPIIRYSIINQENRTGQEADAILNTLFPGQAIAEPDTDSTNESGNFFEDFIIPIIRNKITGEGTKNETEVATIINNIIVSEREQEESKKVDDGSNVDLDQVDDGSGNVTFKFIDGILLPDMRKAVDDVVVTPEGNAADIAEASKKAVDDITDDLEEIIENKDDSSDKSEQNAEKDDGKESDEESKSSEYSSSSQASKDSNSEKSSEASGSSGSDESSKSSDSSQISEEKSKASDESKSESASQISEESKSVETSSLSEGSVENNSSEEVGDFVAKYIAPVLAEKINGLQTLSVFFSNPDVLEELRSKLEGVVKEVVSGPLQDGQEQETVGNDGGADKVDVGDGNDNDTEIPLNPVKWFVEQMVIPELQKKAKKIDNLVQIIHSVQGNKSLSETIYNFASEHFAKDPTYMKGANATANASQFISRILVPRIKQAVQKFKNVTSFVSSSGGQSVVVNKIKNFIDELFNIKSQLPTFGQSTSQIVSSNTDTTPQSPASDNSQDATTDSSLGGLLGEMIASAIRKSGERLRTLADKISDPAISNQISKTIKDRINSVIASKNQQRTVETEEDLNISEEETAKNIIEQIVKLKTQISGDRRNIQILELKMSQTNYGAGPNFELVLQKLHLVQDIQTCAITLRQLFTSLRTGQPFKLEENHQKARPVDPTVNSVSEVPTKRPIVALEDDIKQITKANSNIVNYRQKLQEMNEKLRGYYSPNRLTLVREKLKVVWALKDESIKLNHLYAKMRLDQVAADNEMKASKAQMENNDKSASFEMQFTDAEKAKYAGLLQELSFAQAPPSSNSNDEGDKTSVMAGLIVGGVALVAIVMGTIGALVHRRRGGRHRLYTYIPSEERVDTNSILVSKETYGSCK